MLQCFNKKYIIYITLVRNRLLIKRGSARVHIRLHVIRGNIICRQDNFDVQYMYCEPLNRFGYDDLDALWSGADLNQLILQCLQSYQSVC